MTPEEKARQQIDAMLTASGWSVQTKDRINLSASRGVAVCELSFDTGEPDYTLFVDAKSIGTVEAKPEGHSLVGVEEQSTKYAKNAASGNAANNIAPYEMGKQLLQRILAERLAAMTKKRDWLQPEGELPSPLPEGWTVCSVDQVAECFDGKRVPINKVERARRHGAVPYYGANGQVGWIDSHIFDEPLVLVVEDETFTGRTQSFSYMIRGKAWVNNHAHVLRASQAVSTAYLNYSFAFYPFTPRTTGSTGRRKLTQKALMTAPYMLPPLPEQTRIVAEVERRLSVVEELEAVVSANLQRATRLRQSILQKAFLGGLA